MAFNMEAQLQLKQQQSTQLNSAIQHVNSVRRSLSQNASEVKSQIHAGISRHLEALRNREVWLLNQVDLLVNVKDDVLQRQQARLNQQLGVLQSCLAYTEENEMKHLDEFSQFQLSDLKPEENPFIRFKSDPSILRESIVNYGKIDGNGILHSQAAFVDHKNPSTSLPRAFEDYDDGDHMMSYKTVQTDVHVFNRPLSMKIPKLSTRPEDWLARSSGTMTTSTKSSPRFSFPHVSSKTSDWLMSEKDSPQPQCLPKSSTDSSIQNWLRQIKRNPVSEEEDFEIVASTSPPESESGDSVEWLNSDTSPEFLSMKGKPSPSPSNEWLKDNISWDPASCDEFHPRSVFAHYFKEISTDLNRWLLSCHKCNDKLSESGSISSGLSRMKNSENVSEPPYVDMSRYLGDICAEKYKWLDQRHQSSLDKLSHISSVCKTKKPCSEYKENSVTPKCPSLIQEISTSRDGKQPAYLAGLEKYLKNDVSAWLLYKPESVQSTTSFDSPLFDDFAATSSTVKWLKEPEIDEKPVIPEFKEMMRNDKDIRAWLKVGQDHPLPSPTTCWPHMVNGIHSYSKMFTNDQWLSKEHRESLPDELS